MLNKLFFPTIFALIIFEGLIRKSFPAVGTQALLLKDILIVGVFMFQVWHIKFNKNFDILKLVYILYSLVFLISLLSLISYKTNTFLYGLGFREYFFYAALGILSFQYFTKLGIRGTDNFISNLTYAGFFITLAGIMHTLGILNLSILESIKDVHQEHSSAYGSFYFTSSIFDIPEKYAIFNVLLFLLVYSSLRSNHRIVRYEYLFLMVFLIGTIISGRRVAIFLLVLVILYDYFINRKSVKGFSYLFLASIIILPSVFYSVVILDPVLAKVLFSVNTVENALYYLNWSFDLFTNALYKADLFTGIFGITSPGSDLFLNKYNLFEYEIEGFWDKTLFSLGISGTILLFISMILLLFKSEGLRRKFFDDYAIRAISSYLIVITGWGIKSGNFLVWTPLTFVIIGILLSREFYKKIEYKNK